MTKNILFYFSWQLKPVHFGVVINKLQTILANSDKDTKVYFLVCNGSLKPCYTNKFADPAVCKLCIFNNWAGLQPFKSQIEILKISQFESNDFPVKKNFDYNSIDAIKKITYKGVKIGYGALSSYISFTRNLEPIMDSEFRSYFNDILSNEVLLTDVILKIFEEKDINESYFFNGRTADTRPLYDLCLKFGIDFTSLELIMKKDDEFYINEFHNCLPHDIDFHHSRMMSLWKDTNDPDSVKSKVGSSFFENRRHGKLVGDRKVYTEGQEEGRLPSQFNNTQKNVVIFVSSEDEFVAIGDVFESKALFKTQYTGIIKILEKYKDDEKVDFYIRIHPNLSEIKYAYHLNLKNLEITYKNTHVIVAKSKISSYALIDASDIIITFGSSTGVEACFWEKPVVLLAGAFYYHLDVAYIPKEEEELFNLLADIPKPKPKSNAIKYGYYIVNYSNYTLKNSLSPVPIKFLNKQLGLKHHHLKILGSSVLYRIVEKMLSILVKLLPTKKRVVPVKGI